MKTLCLIVDDEPLAIQLLENHLAQLENFEVVATSNNAVKALEILRSRHIDLLFCDIKMPNLSGIDLLRTIKNPPKTILTTAHREFALEGFELEVLDYLLKPITFERFLKSIEKYLRVDGNLLPPSIQKQLSKMITIKSNNVFYKINTADILYIESQKDYCKFFLKENEITAKYKISELEKELVENGFLRVHRSFLINTHHLQSYTVSEVRVGKHTLPIGQNFKEVCMRYLEEK